MDIQSRNKQVLEYTNLIYWTIHKNKRLIKTLYLEEEDVFQDLMIAAMKAIEGFDSSRSDSMFTHVCVKLQYEILDIKRRCRPGGITGSKGNCVTLKSIEHYYYDDKPLEIIDQNTFNCVEIIQLIKKLKPAERRVVQMKIKGEPVRRKKHKADLRAAQDKLRTMIDGRALICC